MKPENELGWQNSTILANPILIAAFKGCRRAGNGQNDDSVGVSTMRKTGT
jgi:hypothetical protein